MALKNFNQLYRVVRKESPYEVHKKYRDDTGEHPIHYSDIECEFASKHLEQIMPEEQFVHILDVGSYRKFVLGLLSRFYVDTLDVRKIQGKHLHRERRIEMDINNLNSNIVEANTSGHKYDVVLSLSALEHFGLGRYGDEFDLKADEKAFINFINALQPGGYLIFTTTIRRGLPELCFNAHRTYNLQLLHIFCSSLELVEEQFYSRELKRLCSEKEVTTKSQTWDVYMGCWRKKE